MRERVLGGEHPEVAAALNNLAVLLRGVDKASSGLQPYSCCAVSSPSCSHDGTCHHQASSFLVILSRKCARHDS